MYFSLNHLSSKVNLSNVKEKLKHTGPYSPACNTTAATVLSRHAYGCEHVMEIYTMILEEGTKSLGSNV